MSLAGWWVEGGGPTSAVLQLFLLQIFSCLDIFISMSKGLIVIRSPHGGQAFNKTQTHTKVREIEQKVEKERNNQNPTEYVNTKKKKDKIKPCKIFCGILFFCCDG